MNSQELSKECTKCRRGMLCYAMLAFEHLCARLLVRLCACVRKIADIKVCD